MKVALIGDGKMGRSLAGLAQERGHQVTAMIGAGENRGGAGIDSIQLGHPDMAIEFTEPAAALANVMACLRAGIPVVTGTTGWYDDLPAAIRETERTGGALLWAPNFSIGVAVMTAAVEAVAGALREVSAFDVHLVETHHAAKKDKPSGTASALAAAAARAIGRDVAITSVRTGHVPGTHEVIFDAPYEQVRVVHEARDRRVFADGALAAAEWLLGRRGVFTMRDVVHRREEAS